MVFAYVVLAMLGAATVAMAGDCISQPSVGLCMARIPRYFYNVNSGECELFYYGGCGGNQNNYKTLEQCEQSCTRLSLEDCSAEPETGMCRAAFPRHYFDVASGTCKEFIYGGCGGNKNNFGDESECQQRCGQFKKDTSLSLEECSAEPVTGMCDAYIPSYAFNPKTGKCESFVYGGCGGNTNRFESEELCNSQCGKYATYQAQETGLTLEECSMEAETGLCRAYIPSYAFNPESGKCEFFVYGGCGGNVNRFASEEHCLSQCGKYAPAQAQETGLTLEECSMEAETGLCRAYIPSYAFNPESGKCEFFVYGGCGGNVNRFYSEEHCLSQCGKYAPAQAQETGLTLEQCSMEPETGMCRAYFPSYAFNPESGKCEFFVYGGCGGNVNRFASEEHCLSQCGKYAPAQAQETELTLQECSMMPVTGLCLAYIPSYAFNPASGKCEFFVYGGCGGNANRFASEEQCLSQCGKYAPDQAQETELTLEECSMKPETGRCRAYFPSYAFNPESGKCEFFVYGGCGGNVNRFASEDHCLSQCGKYAPARSPVPAVDCTAEPEPGVCLAYIPSFFYNIKTGKCEKFVYGGCGGNGNRFQTVADCEDSCLQTIPVVDERVAVGLCGQAKEVGLCKAAIPRYYYDVSTGSCQKFIYGGCGGNDNNFKTVEECHNTCVA